MTKTEQLRRGLLASGAKKLEAQPSRRYEVFSLELATTVRDPSDGTTSSVMREWFLFLGKGAGLRISKTPASSNSIPVGALQYHNFLTKGATV